MIIHLHGRYHCHKEAFARNNNFRGAVRASVSLCVSFFLLVCLFVCLKVSIDTLSIHSVAARENASAVINVNRSGLSRAGEPRTKASKPASSSTDGKVPVDLRRGCFYVAFEVLLGCGQVLSFNLSHSRSTQIGAGGIIITTGGLYARLNPPHISLRPI